MYPFQTILCDPPPRPCIYSGGSKLLVQRRGLRGRGEGRGGRRGVEEEEKGSFQLSSTLRISQISHRRIFSNHGSPGHDSPGLDNVGAAEGILQVAWEGTGFTG